LFGSGDDLADGFAWFDALGQSRPNGRIQFVERFHSPGKPGQTGAV
jgi:hypothetical protein